MQLQKPPYMFLFSNLINLIFYPSPFSLFLSILFFLCTILAFFLIRALPLPRYLLGCPASLFSLFLSILFLSLHHHPCLLSHSRAPSPTLPFGLPGFPLLPFPPSEAFLPSLGPYVSWIKNMRDWWPTVFGRMHEHAYVCVYVFVRMCEIRMCAIRMCLFASNSIRWMSRSEVYL